MKWFAVKYVYQIVSGEGNHTPQFDEQIRLLLSRSITEALLKAQGLARQFQDSFKNIRGEDVSWKFIGISGLHEIEAPEDGTEVTSFIHEPTDAEAFKDHVGRCREYLSDVLETVPVN